VSLSSSLVDARTFWTRASLEHPLITLGPRNSNPRYFFISSETNYNRKNKAKCWLFRPVILAIKEAEIRRLVARRWLEQKLCKILSQK
jgi:hypothetical protein